MRFGISLSVFAILVLIISCSQESIQNTIDSMRKEACNANYEGFFQYVDKRAVRKNFKEHTMKEFTQGATEAKLSERSQEIPVDYKNEFVPEHMRDLWSNYENWIDSGQSGPLCKMKIDKIDGDSVTVNIPGHPDAIWGFQKIDGTWKLQSIM